MEKKKKKKKKEEKKKDEKQDKEKQDEEKQDEEKKDEEKKDEEKKDEEKKDEEIKDAIWDSHKNAMENMDMAKILLAYDENSIVQVYKKKKLTKYIGTEKIKNFYETLFQSLGESISSLEILDSDVEEAPGMVILTWRWSDAGDGNCTNTYVYTDKHKVKWQNVVIKYEKSQIDTSETKKEKTELTVNVRACGKSALSLPEIGVGTWSWGGNVESYWGNQEQKDSNAVIDVALKTGCNFFDTAEVYNNGDSETQLGKVLKGKFGDVIVGSKILPKNCTPAGIRSSLEGTLNRLGTDSIDLYMVHWPLNKKSMGDAWSETAVADCFNTLKELQSEGLIKHIGVSNFGVKQLTEALKIGVTIAVNQLVYNLLTRAIEFEVMEFCASNGIGIICYSPLMQGLLTTKFGSLSEVPDTRLRTRHFSGERNLSRHGEKGFEDLTWQTILNIKKIAADADIDMAVLCLAWPLTNANITCVIPGNRTKEQMENNARAGTMKLSEDIIAALNKATNKLKEHMGSAIDMYEGLNNQRSY